MLKAPIAGFLIIARLMRFAGLLPKKTIMKDFEEAEKPLEFVLGSELYHHNDDYWQHYSFGCWRKRTPIFHCDSNYRQRKHHRSKYSDRNGF